MTHEDSRQMTQHSALKFTELWKYIIKDIGCPYVFGINMCNNKKQETVALTKHMVMNENMES